jgi:hypothetical protein
MKFQINEKILMRTTDCRCYFHCLNGESGKMCIADSPVNEDGLFLKKVSDKDCPYLRKIGFSFVSHICTCPTRREIYERYNQ